jgi:glycosyltransferase involved in cell wall biosynthesis
MHGLDFHRYALPPGIPTLVTLHMPISWYDPEVLEKFRHRVQFCCVSDAQKSTCPPHLSRIPVIENGVEIPAEPRQGKKSNFAVVMGRICEEKNQHAALEAGSLAGTSVLLYGRVFPYADHKQYFNRKIEPLLRDQSDGVRHRFLGPVCADQKLEMLSFAKCLLHPTLAPETSSLIAMEALAAGTPVIAYPAGALRDIVSDGLTGFLVRDIAEMAEAIRKVDRISPAICRFEAAHRFARDQMAVRYISLYQTLVESPGRLDC